MTTRAKKKTEETDAAKTAVNTETVNNNVANIGATIPNAKKNTADRAKDDKQHIDCDDTKNNVNEICEKAESDGSAAAVNGSNDEDSKILENVRVTDDAIYIGKEKENKSDTKNDKKTRKTTRDVVGYDKFGLIYGN